MEVHYNGRALHSDREIEKIVISKQTSFNIDNPHHMHIGRLPDNLQVYFQQQNGRASQINFNKKYNHINAILNQDYREDYIEAQEIADGYVFRMHSHGDQRLVPISGSYRVKNNEEFITCYFVLDYFFNPDYTARENVILPHHRDLIDHDLTFRVANGEPLERIHYDALTHSFTLPNPSIIHVNLFHIANIRSLPGDRICVTDFAASTVFFNKCALQNGNMVRQLGHNESTPPINSFFLQHHTTDQRFIDPKNMEEEPLVPKVFKRDLRDEHVATSLLRKIREENDIPENIHKLEEFLHNRTTHLSPMTSIKCYATLLRHDGCPILKENVDNLLSEYEDRLSHEEFIDNYIILVKAKNSYSRSYAETLKNFLLFYQNEISSETLIKGWIAVTNASLESQKENAKVLKNLLIQNQTLLAPIRVKGWIAVTNAQLENQKEDACTLKNLLYSKKLSDITQAQGWQSVLNSRMRINYETFTTIQRFIPYAVKKERFVTSMSRSVFANNTQECKTFISFLTEWSNTFTHNDVLKGSLSFFQRNLEKMKRQKFEEEGLRREGSEERERSRDKRKKREEKETETSREKQKNLNLSIHRTEELAEGEII